MVSRSESRQSEQPSWGHHGINSSSVLQFFQYTNICLRRNGRGSWPGGYEGNCNEYPLHQTIRLLSGRLDSNDSGLVLVTIFSPAHINTGLHNYLGWWRGKCAKPAGGASGCLGQTTPTPKIP